MNNKEAYNKGFDDGMKAISFHKELCADELSASIKNLGKEMRLAQKAIKDKKVLIGFNMAIALCNKHLGADG